MFGPYIPDLRATTLYVQDAPAFVTFLTAGFPSVASTVPVMLAMERGGADIVELGYHNPFHAYGEEQAVVAAKRAGANGFIVVDLPPEEAVSFRSVCRREGMSYIPLVAPYSFLYVVSKMGPTGASDKVSSSLSCTLSRTHRNLPRPVPLAVGFGVSTPAHFEEVGAQAEGVVMGSQLISVIKEAAASGSSAIARAVEAYCAEVCANRRRVAPLAKVPWGTGAGSTKAAVEEKAKVDEGRFGEFGGAYVPEPLFGALAELSVAYSAARADPTFQEELDAELRLAGRSSELYEAKALSARAGGARIWLKREELLRTGSAATSNVFGQILLARRMGKTRIVAEAGSGDHGLATVAVCRKLGLDCVILVAGKHANRSTFFVDGMKLLGAEVRVVEGGLKEAINEALRDWLCNLFTTHYLPSSATGPAPFPIIVRDFQSVLGSEVKEQMLAKVGRLPDAVVACTGGSSGVGLFHPFILNQPVRLIGVEAAGKGLHISSHAAALSCGSPGVLHGSLTCVLQSPSGQILDTHSTAAELEYPGVAPELAWLYKTRRMEVLAVTDKEALEAAEACRQTEGFELSAEAGHAVCAAMQLAGTMRQGANIVVSVSGTSSHDERHHVERHPRKGSNEV
ncbi:hypothetical protein JCM10213v2_005527 [Rhodosporidiobolus nylandii]